MTEHEVIEELTGTWELLDRPVERRLRSARTNIRCCGGMVHVGVDRLGARHLLLPDQSGLGERALWRNAAMDLRGAGLHGEDGVLRPWLLLRCKRADVEDAFARVAAQVVCALHGHLGGDAPGVCLAVLREWQELFGRGPSTPEAVAGLIGELLALEQLVRIDQDGAWEAWEGPRGGRHDFRRGQHALEVKTTTRPAGRVVHVNGAWQLCAPSGGSLHVWFFRLERVAGGSASIGALVDRLVRLGVPHGELLELLEELGFENLADGAAFEVRETRLFIVDERCPRIIASSFAEGGVPPGIAALVYTSDLDRATLVDAAREQEVLERICHG